MVRGDAAVKVNVFRIGRWLTGAAVLVWLAGCIRDFVYFEAWNMQGLHLAGVLAFTAVGVGAIIGVAWGIGKILRQLLRVPSGRDFRPDDPAQVF